MERGKEKKFMITIRIYQSFEKDDTQKVKNFNRFSEAKLWLDKMKKEFRREKEPTPKQEDDKEMQGYR